MIETTKETIKFARSWLENAEKYGDPNVPTTGTMTALARAVMELADEVKKLENINMDHLEELDRQEWLLDNANEELAALKEKYRWRNVDEEEPPRETEVLICCVSRSGVHKYVYTASFDGEDFYDRRGDAPSGEVKRWRPLDLPEMGEAK